MPRQNNFNLDFLGIGAQRSGTTWIAECLREHPEICLSSPKEIHFFGTEKYRKLGFNWYRKHFNCRPNQIRGEFDPGYFMSEKAAEQIRENFPDIKLIVCLRNPTERAFSNYLSTKDLQPQKKSFEESIKQNPQALERGLYYKHLKKYFELFPEENILVLIYEEIKKNPEEFIKKIYNFLDVDKNFKPSGLNRKSNTSKEYRLPFVKRWLGKLIKKVKKSYYGVSVSNFFRKIGFKKIYYFIEKINTKKIRKKPTIKKQTETYLRNYYREDIRNLEQLIQKDLNSWK